MKHKLKITLILLAMFVIAQFIGLFVINHYSIQGNELPYGMGVDEDFPTDSGYTFLPSIIIAFIIAFVLMFLLTKFGWNSVLRIWFLFVILIGLGISFNSVLPNEKFVPLMALIFALPLALIKVFRQNFLIHNLTELLIYPGIASVFVPILNLKTMIILLIIISVYDMWAVWKSGIMIKMAKYQMNTLKIFGGFMVPYLSKKQRQKLKKIPKEKRKNKKVRVELAILGGGDVVFPIITAGVMLKTFGISGALLTIAGATLGLTYLFLRGEKKKAYPAMPFITAGIFLGMLISWLVL